MRNIKWVKRGYRMRKKCKFVRFSPKYSVTLLLDADIVEYFKATGKGWQTRVDAVLREYIQTHPV